AGVYTALPNPLGEAGRRSVLRDQRLHHGADDLRGSGRAKDVHAAPRRAHRPDLLDLHERARLVRRPPAKSAQPEGDVAALSEVSPLRAAHRATRSIDRAGAAAGLDPELRD